MDKFLINGPCKIKGKVSISGSKNASLPILAATLLFDKPVTIKNLPRVRDIDTMLNLLKSLGSKIILSKDNSTSLYIPRGFAHAYYSYSSENIIYYKLDNFYKPKYESGIIYNDSRLKIRWPNRAKIVSLKEAFKNS